ncbi:MAG: ComEA family DNA-binding protein [Gammaproteobacteria bacterium]|nr:ComEA family DNA-binding protein [Gammaproteobacteria bacterium]
MSHWKHLLLALLCSASLAATAADRVNINTANAEQLAAVIDGIGPAKAQAIIEYREKHGPFKSIEDLALVRGIGESTLKKNRDRLALDDKSPAK